MYQMTEKQIEEYMQYLREQERSVHTIEKYHRDIGRFYRTLSEDRTFSKEETLRYKKTLQENYAPSSVNSMLTALNGFLRFIGAGDACVKLCRQQRQSFLPEEKELTKEEYQNLLAKAKEQPHLRLYYILETMECTGIRISELQYITVEGVKRGRILVCAKNKYRCICISESLKARLLEYCEKEQIESGCIFITRNGNPVHRNNVWTDMKKLSKKAGIRAEKVHPHNFRHLFARTFYEKEKDVLLLADLLGHSSVDTTRIYTRISERRLNDEVLELGLTDKNCII